MIKKLYLLLKGIFFNKKFSELKERKPLPIGMTEFEEWSDRIILLANLPATHESQKFTLANMLLHLPPTESHKEDIYFVHSLRKFAVNQIADAVRVDIRERVKARLAKEEADKIANKPELDISRGAPYESLPSHEKKLLEQPRVQTA